MNHDDRFYRVLHNYWKFLQIVFGFEMLVLLRQLRFVLILIDMLWWLRTVSSRVSTQSPTTRAWPAYCASGTLGLPNQQAPRDLCLVVLSGSGVNVGDWKKYVICMVLKRILILGRALCNLVEFIQHTPVTFCWFYLYCCTCVYYFYQYRSQCKVFCIFGKII